MKFKLFLMVLVFGFCANYSQAQCFSGQLLNVDTIPVEYANIIVYEHDSVFLAGTMSDTSGKFSITLKKKVNLDEVVIQISHISYLNYQIKPTSYQLGIIFLQVDAMQLGEITVTATIPLFRLQGSTMVANVSETNLKEMGSASKILDFLPGIYSDDGQFKIFGKGAAIFYVNNRQLMDLSVLEHMSSEDISTIEIIKNPGVEYPASTNAVIKINTKRPKDNGFSLQSWTLAQQAHETTGQEVINATFRHNNLDILGSFNLISYALYHDINFENNLFTDDNIKSVGNNKLYSRYNVLAGSLGFDYYFNEKNSIGVLYRYNYSQDKGRRKQFLRVTKKSPSGDEEFDENYRSEYRTTNLHNRVGVYYSGDFGNVKLDFNNDFYVASVSDIFDLVQDSISIDDRSTVKTRNKLSHNIFVSQLKTTHSTPFGKFKEGLEFYDTKRTHNFKNIENLIPPTDEKVNQRKYAAFIDYTHEIDNVLIEMGLRYEHVDLNYEKDNLTVDGFPKRYSGLAGFYPSVSLSFPIGNVNFDLSYSRNTSQPSYSQLDGSIMYESKYLYKSGNMVLEPAFIHDISFAASYNDFMFSAEYLNKKNNMVEVYKYYNDNPASNIIMGSYANYKKASLFLFDLSYSHKFGFWTPRLGFDLSLSNYNMFDTSLTSNKFQTPYYAIKLTNVFEISETFNIYLYAEYSSRGFDEYIHYDPSMLVYVEIQKEWKNFQLMVVFNDIFRTVREKTLYASPLYTQSYDLYFDTQNIQIGLTYTFNPKRSKYKGSNVANSEVSRL